MPPRLVYRPRCKLVRTHMNSVIALNPFRRRLLVSVALRSISGRLVESVTVASHTISSSVTSPPDRSSRWEPMSRTSRSGTESQ